MQTVKRIFGGGKRRDCEAQLLYMRSKRDSLWLFKNTATVLVSEILHAPGSKALKSALVLVVCQRSHIAWFTEYADSGCRVSAYIIGQCVHGRRSINRVAFNGSFISCIVDRLPTKFELPLF